MVLIESQDDGYGDVIVTIPIITCSWSAVAFSCNAFIALPSSTGREALKVWKNYSSLVGLSEHKRAVHKISLSKKWRDIVTCYRGHLD